MPSTNRPGLTGLKVEASMTDARHDRQPSHPASETQPDNAGNTVIQAMDPSGGNQKRQNGQGWMSNLIRAMSPGSDF